jgi:hypothetical protein
MRDISRPPPGDVVNRPKKVSGNLAKQKSSYFEDAFRVEDSNPARERIQCESIVMAEVRTNVIVRPPLHHESLFQY